MNICEALNRELQLKTYLNYDGKQFSVSEEASKYIGKQFVDKKGVPNVVLYYQPCIVVNLVGHPRIKEVEKKLVLLGKQLQRKDIDRIKESEFGRDMLTAGNVNHMVAMCVDMLQHVAVQYFTFKKIFEKKDGDDIKIAGIIDYDVEQHIEIVKKAMELAPDVSEIGPEELNEMFNLNKMSVTKLETELKQLSEKKAGEWVKGFQTFMDKEFASLEGNEKKTKYFNKFVEQLQGAPDAEYPPITKEYVAENGQRTYQKSKRHLLFEAYYVWRALP